MPRHDSFDTNREIQVDFTNIAHGVFVAAAERQLEAKITPAYEDKPLDHLFLHFRKIGAPITEMRKNTITGEEYPTAYRNREELKIRPLTESKARSLHYSVHGRTRKNPREVNELFQDGDEYILEHYMQLAKVIGATAITDSLRFSQLPPNAIDASWDFRGKGRDRHADTFMERPSKQSLVSAKFFAEEALAYIQSDSFDQQNDPLGSIVKSAVNEIARRESDLEIPIAIEHTFGLDFTPDLPLNGHESQRFLTNYRNEMAATAARIGERLEKLRRIGAPEEMLESLVSHLDTCEHAKKRAEKFLK